MVSIIVPVYNCEKYLKRCVNSILMQTETDLQLILVDDGSTDGSGRLCDDFAAKDGRILVVHQKNAGVSAARNAGLDAASGEFVCFVDADDTLEPNMVERTTDIKCISDADMVLFDPVVHQPDPLSAAVDSMPFYPTSRLINKEDISPDQLRFMAGTVWRVLYKRELIENNRLRFDITLPLSEDRLFNLIAMGCSKQIYYLREPLYHYWIYPGSAARRYRSNMLEVVTNTHLKVEKTIKKYWGCNYVPIYERVNLVDGALLCIYNEFSKYNTKTVFQKYITVKQVVTEPVIRAAYGKLKKKTVRQWLVWCRCSGLLCLVGWLWNIKNKK